MNGSRSLPALIAGLALILAACGAATRSTTAEPFGSVASTAPSESAAASETASASESAAAEGELVRLTGFAFEPTELTIAAGTEVSFANADSAAHTVTEGVDGTEAEDAIIDEELEQGESTSFTFDEPGEYQITCIFHPSMNMTITVEG